MPVRLHVGSDKFVAYFFSSCSRLGFKAVTMNHDNDTEAQHKHVSIETSQTIPAA